MKVVQTVNPFVCRMWDLHDRLEADITEESCKSEIESFLKHGQLIPVLGRRISGESEYDIELIYGARRLFAARHLNMPLTVELCELSDREALLAMDIENRQRKDLSPFEYGCCYARWLRLGYFDSQESLARVLNLSRSQVSRLLKLARLPEAIVCAFEKPADLCEKWGLELVEACEDPLKQQAILAEACALRAESASLKADVIFRRLIGRALSPARIAQEAVVADATGAVLFRLRRDSSSVTLLFPTVRMSSEILERVQHAVTEILHSACSREDA